MADIKFSQFTNIPTPNANSYFVGYNSVTGINGRTSLTDLIAAIGAPSGSGTANFVSKWSGTNTLTDSLIQDDGDVVQVYGIYESLLYLDKTQPFSYLLSTDFSGILNGTKLVTIGDVFQNYNGTNILVDLDAQIIKTQNGGDIGLYLDFANSIYTLGAQGDSNTLKLDCGNNIFQLGRTDNFGLYLDLANSIYKLGDYNYSFNNGTTFIVDDLNAIIKTLNNGADKGLYIDFANNVYNLGVGTRGLYINLNTNLYKLGDYDDNNNFTYFGIDDDNKIIKTSCQSTDKGLYIDFTTKLYKLGDFDTTYNGTSLILDDENYIIKTTSSGYDKGLFFDFANNQYSLGDYDGAINGITLLVNDAAQLISFFSPRVQYTGQDSATIAAFTGNTAGQLAYNSDLNSFQYYNGTAWAAVAPKATYMMTGVFTNMFGGDPGGLGKDILDWVGSTPAASHSSALPILQNCRITAAGFKWISSTPIATIAPGDSWTIQVFKMINPLTASTTADGNFTLVGDLNITLTSANSGTTPGVFSSGLNLTLNAGDIIRIAGVETGAIGTTTEEAQLTVLFELI
jgi:hypothetical protein